MKPIELDILLVKKLFFIVIYFCFSSGYSQELWYGDPSRNYLDSFYRLSRESGEKGTVSTVNDPEFGKVWKLNKPKGDKRCEFARTEGKVNRYTPKEGDLIYLGWRMKVNIAGSSSPGGFAVFQWKSNAPHSQNYPFAMGYEGGNKIGLSAYDAGGNCQSCKQEKLLTYTVPENTWVSIVLGIKVSKNENKGYIECWINGVKQDLAKDDSNKRFKHRTLDDNGNYCKWGAYNEASRNFNIDVFLDEMRMGTTLASVMDPLQDTDTPNTAPSGVFKEPGFSTIGEGYDRLYVNVAAEDADGDAIDVLLKIDGQEIRKEGTAPFEWGHVSSTIDFTSETLDLLEGDHLLEAVITDIRGASTTITKPITVTSGTLSIHENFKDRSLQLYPNPVQNILFIKGNHLTDKMIRIYDMIGSLKASKQLTQHQNSVDLSNLSEGMYIAKITNSRTHIGTRTLKITKL